MTKTENEFDVIIIGGSYAGLSAAMALGRALRNVLIIDNGKPCNTQTPYSHNFITQDGEKPKVIADKAKLQVLKYKTIQFYNGSAIAGLKHEKGFKIKTESSDLFTANKLIFATGVKDMMPNIKGFAACWGISIIHCPYCHGYEFSQVTTGIFANGDMGFELGRLISNWTKDLTLFTNGPSTLTQEQTDKLANNNININEKAIENFTHNNGQLEKINFKDGTLFSIKILYARPGFEQHCTIPAQLGCTITEQNYIHIDAFQKTNIYGIYACGDNTTLLRSVANAVAMGNLAGAMVNKELIDEEF